MTRFTEMRIGPEEAEEMLSRNYGSNRKVRKAWVGQLAQMMSSGEFVSQNGETIIVDESGTLYNGQHRMHAVVESGREFTFDVAVIPDETAEAAYKTMDNTTKRQAADFVDGDNKKLRATIAKVAYAVEHGNAPLASALQGKLDTSTHASRMSMSEYANTHVELMDRCVRIGNRMRHAIGAGPASSYAVAAFVIVYCGDDLMLDDFADEVCNDLTQNRTCAAFATAVRKAYLVKNKPTKKWLVGTMLDAYTHFKDMDDSTMLNKASTRLSAYSKAIDEERSRRRGK